jgi:hypothetical protein
VSFCQSSAAASATRWIFSRRLRRARQAFIAFFLLGGGSSLSMVGRKIASDVFSEVSGEKREFIV